MLEAKDFIPGKIYKINPHADFRVARVLCIARYDCLPERKYLYLDPHDKEQIDASFFLLVKEEKRTYIFLFMNNLIFLSKDWCAEKLTRLI